MNVKDYDGKMDLAFVESQGGLYFRENYDEAVKSEKTLLDIVNDIIHDYKLDLAEDNSLVGEERLNVQEMTQRIVINDNDRLKFIVDFLHGNKESYPEMCGAVCGVLFRNGELRKVIDFLGLEYSEDEIYWDS